MLHIHLPLRFASAYAAVAGAEPLWTNWHTHGFRECLDYIFVATHSRTVVTEQRGSGAGRSLHTAPASAWEPLVPPARRPRTGGNLDAAIAALVAARIDDGDAQHHAGALAAGGMVPVAVLALPSDADVLACGGGALEGGCPNAGCGSDHIPLAATFRL